MYDKDKYVEVSNNTNTTVNSQRGPINSCLSVSASRNNAINTFRNHFIFGQKIYWDKYMRELLKDSIAVH